MSKSKRKYNSSNDKGERKAKRQAKVKRQLQILRDKAQYYGEFQNV